MVHKYVDEELKEKKYVPPEKFDCVTKLTDSQNALVRQKQKELEENAKKKKLELKLKNKSLKDIET